MNRLDTMIARLTMQRACLVQAAGLVADVAGPVFEVGLGKGRTYDFLREVMGGREIYAFDRDVHAMPGCVPDDAHLFIGAFEETLPGALDRIGKKAALIHADVGSEDRARDARLAAWLGGVLPTLARPGGVILGDRDFAIAGAERLPLPDGISGWPYFMFQMKA